MTLSLILAAPTRSGPGMQVNVNISAGPVPNDDYLIVQLLRTSDDALICRGQKITHGSLNVQVFLGYEERFGAVDFGRPDGFADGTAVHGVVQQYHANGTIVDTQDLGSFGVLDVNANAWSLLWFLAPAQNPTLEAIYNAVVRTYSNA